MSTIERTVELTAEPEQAWAVVSDPNRFGEWLGMHRGWKGDVPTDFAPGSTATAVVGLLGMPTTVTWTVLEYAPPTAVTLTGTGLAGVQVTIGVQVREHGTGSALSVVVTFEGALLTGAIGQAVERAARTELDESVARLAALLG